MADINRTGKARPQELPSVKAAQDGSPPENALPTATGSGKVPRMVLPQDHAPPTAAQPVDPPGDGTLQTPQETPAKTWTSARVNTRAVKREWTLPSPRLRRGENEVAQASPHQGDVNDDVEAPDTRTTGVTQRTRNTRHINDQPDRHDKPASQVGDTPAPVDDIGPPPPQYVPSGPPLERSTSKQRRREKHASMPVLKAGWKSRHGSAENEDAPALFDPARPLEWRSHNRHIIRALRKEIRRSDGYIDPDTAIECFDIYRSWVNQPGHWLVDPGSGRLVEVSSRVRASDSRQAEIPDMAGTQETPASPCMAPAQGLPGLPSLSVESTSADLEARNMIALTQKFLDNMVAANTDPASGAVTLTYDENLSSISLWHYTRMTTGQLQEAFTVRRLLVNTFQECMKETGAPGLFEREMARIHINNLGVQVNKRPPKIALADEFLWRSTWRVEQTRHPPVMDDSWGGMGIGSSAKWIVVRLFNHDAYKYNFSKASIPMRIASALQRIDNGLRDLLEQGAPNHPDNAQEREIVLRSLLCEAVTGLFAELPNPFPPATLDASLYANVQQRLIGALHRLLTFQRDADDTEPGCYPLPYVESIMAYDPTRLRAIVSPRPTKPRRQQTAHDSDS